MRTLPVLVATTLTACGGGGVYADCGYGKVDQIFADGAPEVPTDTSGDVAAAVIGLWQHTYTEDGDGNLSEVSDDSTDIRFSIPDANTFRFCQQVDILGDEPQINESELTIDGLKLDISAAGYTVAGWSDDVLRLHNDYFEDRDEYFLLERMD